MLRGHRGLAWMMPILILVLTSVGYGQVQTSEEPIYPQAAFVGKLELSPDHGPAGTVVTATGTGLPTNATMDLVWHTVRGSWVLKGSNREEYHGRRFDLEVVPLTRVTTDARGQFRAQFRVRKDYGWHHDVMLMQDQVIRNKAAFKLDMQMRVAPTRGPVGTPITIVAEGIGWQNLENSWMVLYDNRFTGWLSSVTTGGLARVIIPATGGPGKHIIQIIHGWATVPYMNMQQSPRPDRPTFTFEFTVTEGSPVLPPAATAQGLPIRRAATPGGTGPAIWADLASAPVGTAFRVFGKGLSPRETVELIWTTVVGSRVSGEGWGDKASPLAKAVVDERGAFAMALTVPDDVGGPHAIVARIGDKTVAETSLTITPSAFALQPASGPVGTVFTVHLKGVGWTETANIYHLVYDNAYVGYACGFNSQGDVEIFLRATGEPGWHFIDLYPGIYRGREVPGVQNFRIPQLTYAADHPGERLPAFRFAFFVKK